MILSQCVYAKMAFILGGTFKISDTRRPICIKLWGRIEFTLKLCNAIFSTLGLYLKTGNWNFPENPTIIPCNVFLDISDFSETETFLNGFQTISDASRWNKKLKICSKSALRLLGSFFAHT